MPEQPDFVLDESRSLILFSGVCTFCKHFDPSSIARPAMTCTAFPDGIPMEIWQGDNPHTQPFPGDNGIQFTPVRS